MVVVTLLGTAAYFLTRPALAIANGDGMTIYGEGTVVTPRSRAWTNATNTFAGEANLPSTTNPTHMVAMKSSPKRQEIIAAVQSTASTSSLNVMHYNGTSWTSDWQFSVGSSNATIRFDVAYDQVTGKGIVVYSGNVATTNELRYRTWDGTAWSAENSYNALRTSNVISYVRAETRPGTDEVAVIWGDDTNDDLSANYFDMSSGTWSGEPGAALSTNLARMGTGTNLNSRPADLAFEQSSGDLLVCWSEETLTDLKCATRTAGTGGSWGAAQTYTSFATTPLDMQMAAEPGTDYIALNSADDGTQSVEAGIWDGSTWGNVTNYDTTLGGDIASSTTNVGVTWLQSGGQSRVVATYDDNDTGISWNVFDKGAGSWSVQADITTSPTPTSNSFAQVVRRNPYNNAEAMVLVHDSGSDLFAKKVTFNGSTFSWSSVEPGGVALETTMTTSSGRGWAVDYAYYNNDNSQVIDNTAAETGTYHDASSPGTVFISDQVGYVFYRNRTGECSYSKTTDGGTTWGAAVTISPLQCLHISVWYDRWTPGDTTGTNIHIIVADSTVDDIRYNSLDTSTDTLVAGGTAVAVSSAPGPAKTNDLTSHDNYPSITKATNGTIYAGVFDSDAAGQQSYILKCSTTCSSAANWSDTAAPMDEGTSTQAKNNGLTLQPLPNGDVMMVITDVALNDVRSIVYTNASSSWAGAWTTVDSDGGFHPNWAGIGVSAVVDKKTNDIYIAYTADASPGLGGGDDDFRSAIYSSGSWTQKSDLITNDPTRGLVTPAMVFNENNADIYVMYHVETTAGTASTGQIYWKKSTDGMNSWSSEQGPINWTSGDFWGTRANMMSTGRVHTIWTEGVATTAEPRTLYGTTVATLTPPTYTQSAYRFFNNTSTTDVGTALANQNTSAVLPTGGAAFRLRTLLHTAGDGARAGLEDFKLQYAGKGSGTCAAPSGGTPSSYTDVTTSTLLAYKNNTPADGANLTSNANDPGHSGHTVDTQTYEEANPFTNTTAKINGGEDGEWDFALMDNGAPAATSYCFRVVKNDGTALTSYSQYPEVSTVQNQAPNDPSSLAQKKTDNTTLNTGDWTNEASVKFTTTASDPDSSDTLQLCVEKKPLGTGFDSTAAAETCGSGVSYSGTPVALSATLGSHTDDQYHWQARIKDAGGAYSNWVSYGSNLESVRDYGVDTTPPTGGTVYDGTNTGVDAAFNDNSLSSLSANWSGFNTNLSGLQRYEYSIGTSIGGTDVRNWTNNTTNTSVTATGLTLQTTKTYYVNVRAVDAAGNVQSAVSSDGQLVLPSLSFGISSNSLTFANLNATNSYTDTKDTTVSTSTNAYGGYVVRAFATDFLRASALSTIPDFNGGTYALPDSWQSGDTGFGYTSSDSDIQGVNKFQNSPCQGGSALTPPGCYAPFSQSKPGDIVADHTLNVTGSPISNEQFTITYRVTAPSGQTAAKNYATTVVYSVTPIY